MGGGPRFSFGASFIFIFFKITYLGARLRPKSRLGGRAGPSPEWVYRVENAGRRQIESEVTSLGVVRA